MTANDVYLGALALLDEIEDDGTAASTDKLGKAPALINIVQKEIARLAGINVIKKVTALTDTLYLLDDHFDVAVYGLAAKFALSDKMADEYNEYLPMYQKLLRTVKPETKVYDPYNILAGMQ